MQRRAEDGLLMLPREAVVTFTDVVGYSVVQRLGYVSGIARRSASPLRSAMRSIGALVGVRQDELLTDAEALRSAALDALCERAGALRANAVLGAQFHATEHSDGTCVVVAFGEAVVLVADRAASA